MECVSACCSPRSTSMSSSSSVPAAGGGGMGAEKGSLMACFLADTGPAKEFGC